MTIKQERAAHLIHNILSALLMTEVTDPALQDITITEVRVDREIEYAEIFVHALGDDSRQAEVMAGLSRASGFLRRELGARIRFRRTPALNFHWDEALEHGDRIDDLLDSLHLNHPPAPPNDQDAGDDQLE
jgi:ribosome-binding factor A